MGDSAVELHALVWQDPLILNSRYVHDLWGRRLTGVAASMSVQRATAAQDRGRSLDLYETATQILEELEGIVPEKQGEG